MSLRHLAAVVLVAAGCLLGARAAGAHTDSDVVAVPAGSVVTVTLKPTHGCGDSPSIKVSTRVPVAGAMGGEVAGWTVTTAADGAGRTVIDWTGGILDAEVVGAFPVELTTPAEVGAILTFPFVQECANGEELAWIDGDPAGERPAPRLLLLPPGSEAAATLDDVPTDAPGREQLVTILDVDNSQVSITSTTASTVPDPADGLATTVAADTDEDNGSAGPLIAGVVVFVVLVGGGGVVVARRRSSS